MHRRFLTFALTLLACAASAVAQDKAAQDKSAADKPKITYDDHVKPILRDHCLTCHNANDAKGGLTLDSYAKTMAGGGSGEVVLPGDPDGSRLYALVAHIEQPIMPPKQDKLADAKLMTIKNWIEGGALENSGSKVIAKKKKTFDFSGGGAGKPAVVAMPENLWRQPVVYTPRTASTTAIAASPWAPIVAIAGQKQVVIYQTDTLECLGVLPFPEGVPYVLRLSPNGSVLLAGGGRGGQSGFVALYDVKTGKRIAKIGDELDAVLAADINAAHTRVALGGPQRLVRIYSTEGELLHEIKKHTDWIYSLAFSPDGVLLASTDRSGGVFVWESETARILELRGHTGGVTDVAWRDDSNILATAGDDGNVKLWEMNDGNAIKTWAAHPGGVTSVAFSHTGTLLSGGKDKTIKTWDGNGAGQKTMPAFTETVLRSAITHDGKRAIAGDWNGDVRVFDVVGATQVGALAANPPTLAMLIDAQTAAIPALETATKECANELAESEKTLQSKTTALDAANAALTTASEAVMKSDAEKAAALKQLDEATAALKSAGATIAPAEAAKKTAEAEKSVAEKAANEKTAVLETSILKVKSAQSDVEKADAEKQTAQQALAEAVGKKDAAEAAANAETIAQAETQRVAGEKQVAEKNKSAAVAAEALKAAQATVESQTKELAVARDNAAAKSQAYQTAAKNLDSAQAVLKTATAAKADAEKRVAAAELATKAATDRLPVAKANVEKLSKEKNDAENLRTAKQTAAQEATKTLAAAQESTKPDDRGTHRLCASWSELDRERGRRRKTTSDGQGCHNATGRATRAESRRGESRGRQSRGDEGRIRQTSSRSKQGGSGSRGSSQSNPSRTRRSCGCSDYFRKSQCREDSTPTGLREKVTLARSSLDFQKPSKVKWKCLYTRHALTGNRPFANRHRRPARIDCLPAFIPNSYEKTH
ncbi:MAG: hypothetical protein QM811_03825 [Pirellulales bacterium]